MVLLATPETNLWGTLVSGSAQGSGGGELHLPRVLDGWNLGEAAAQSVICPSCGHHAIVFVDTFAGDQSYVEDCSVCCRAIELRIQVREYQVRSVQAERPF